MKVWRKACDVETRPRMWFMLSDWRVGEAVKMTIGRRMVSHNELQEQSRLYESTDFGGLWRDRECASQIELVELLVGGRRSSWGRRIE